MHIIIFHPLIIALYVSISPLIYDYKFSLYSQPVVYIRYPDGFTMHVVVCLLETTS